MAPGRPSTPSPERTRPPGRRLGVRSGVMLAVTGLAGLVAFGWPLLVSPTGPLSPVQAPLVFALVLPLLLAVVVAELSGNGLDVKGLAMLGVLSAVGAVLRPLSTGTAGMEPIFFLLILGGRVFGPGFGFVQGAVTMFTSALLTGGVGPWLPYQMLAAGFVGLGAGLLPARLRGRAEVTMLAAYGLVTGFAYGWAMDFAFWPFALGTSTQFSFDPDAGALANLHTFVLYNVATSMGWNLGRGLTSVVLIVLLAPGLLHVLRRAARRAAFVRADKVLPKREGPGAPEE
ncbi:ECF transporter S component [Nigerium massiliense]|uniref:ECF transporter S component n=1 Tax=Nigerium massiliense TaxID=1522317 RepID=UPI0009E4E155